MVRVDHVLDARNLICPMPVIRTGEQISRLQTGQVLEVVCTDPGALADIPAWCRIHGHEVIHTESLDGETLIRLRIGR